MNTRGFGKLGLPWIMGYVVCAVMGLGMMPGDKGTGDLTITISGRVISSFSEKPIAGAQVKVEQVGGSAATLETDRNGLFSLTVSLIGGLSFSISYPGYYPLELLMATPPSTPIEAAMIPVQPQRPAAPRVYSTPSRVYLEWDPNPEFDLKGYRIWREFPTKSPEIVADLVRGTEYEDANVSEGQEFFYYVQAMGKDDYPSVLSEPSIPVSAQRVVLYCPSALMVVPGIPTPSLWLQGTADASPAIGATDGQWVRIPVCAESAYGIGAASMEITMRLPNDVFEADAGAEVYVETTDITRRLSVMAGDFPTYGFVEDGILRISASGATNSQLFGRGVLFDVYARLRDDATCPDGLPVELLDAEGYPPQPTVLADEMGRTIRLDLRPGTVFVSFDIGCLLGDVNWDGAVTWGDYHNLQLAAANPAEMSLCNLSPGSEWDPYGAYDVYADAKVNMQDVTRLGRWLRREPWNPAGEVMQVKAGEGDITPIVVAPPVHIEEGQTEVTVPIQVVIPAEGVDLSAFEITLAYPTGEEGLTFEEAGLGEDGEGGGTMAANADEAWSPYSGLTKVTAAEVDPPAPGATSTVVEVTFGVGEDFTSTGLPPVTIVDFAYSDPFGFTPMHDAPGAVAVGGLVAGDVTGDGVANYKDASWILQQAVGLRTVPYPNAGDVSGEGVVNYKDASWILQAAVGLRTLK